VREDKRAADPTVPEPDRSTGELLRAARRGLRVQPRQAAHLARLALRAIQRGKAGNGDAFEARELRATEAERLRH